MSDVRDKLIPKLEAIARQFDDLERQLADPAVVEDHHRVRTLGVKRSALARLVEQYRKYQKYEKDIAESRQIITDRLDNDLVELAKEQLPHLEQQAQELVAAIASELVTAEDRAVSSVILEIRAASGGAEAALWAADLYDMYERFTAAKGYEHVALDFSPGEQGGLRNIIANVQGQGVWQALGYEAGVHCVKRVPRTEAQGRVHTSTATVAVLAEPEQVQIDIPESDVKIDITTAQGPGGQNVNKVATAVHMIHLPTGVQVRIQQSKSQHQNRLRAWQLLRTRVYDYHQQRKEAERAESRAKMIGTGGRSERIRTYRFKENLVVDHRLGKSFNLPAMLSGHLDPMIDELIALDRAKRLAAL